MDKYLFYQHNLHNRKLVSKIINSNCKVRKRKDAFYGMIIENLNIVKFKCRVIQFSVGVRKKSCLSNPKTIGIASMSPLGDNFNSCFKI